MIRFGIKIGIAAGACYYLAEEGVWSESTKTTELYEKICVAVSPLLKEATAQVPIEIPALPSSEKISYLSKHYWNNGVSSAFEFLGELPDRATEWTISGIKSLTENPEMKKFVDSLTAAPPPRAPVVPEKK